MRRIQCTHVSAVLAALCACLQAAASARAADHAFTSAWDRTPDRVWTGPAYWANPMENWRVQSGRLECTAGGGNRNVYLLTHELAAQNKPFVMHVVAGTLAPGEGSAGFRIGIRDEIDDYRAAALRGRGLNMGVTTSGLVFIGSPPGIKVKRKPLPGRIRLQLNGTPKDGQVLLQLVAADAMTGELIGQAEKKVASSSVSGGVALVNNVHARASGRAPKGALARQARYWFDDWKLDGARVAAHDDRAWGPILWAMHSVTRGAGGYVMKMTAQMPPIGATEAQSVRLEMRADKDWRELAEAPIDPLARTATFRVAGWDASRDTPYRLVYAGADGVDTWEGVVRRDPVDRPLVVAGFTGNTDFGFPNNLIVRNVGIHDPDIMFFSGDQLYENVGGYGIIRAPVEPSVLNYLRKWYLLGWAFGDLMRDRISLSVPDDHDVYQGNIWGQGGVDPGGIRNHAKGGYAQHEDFVNVVHRTQTAHHPDPYDPTPIARGISVYYGAMTWGRVSLAVIADRMFKSGPQGKVNRWKGRPDHVRDPNFDPQSVNKPGLKLLGDRQLKFLDDWAGDWAHADIKCVLSQTIFCNLANYHGGNKMYLVADLDSNGWPQDGRNRALRVMRKGMAFHLAGDQHLASIVHHGIDTWADAGWSFCVPSIAAGYPRSWRPDAEGRPFRNRKEDADGELLANTGDYIEGLGNRVSVYAIANPEPKNRPGRIPTLHDKASGYGIVRFDQSEQTITIECHRLMIDAKNPKPGDQFPGWPRTIRAQDNDGRKATGYLPEVNWPGGRHGFVVRVYDQASGERVYARRIRDERFKPPVFRAGVYRVEYGEPEAGKWKTISDLKPHKSD